jgi:hypothetical protein
VTLERAIALAYLVMAVLNLAWQGATLRHLVKGSTVDSRLTPFYRGLLRTARCRVGAALLYLGVGLNALYPRLEVALVTLGVHALTMGVFGLNALADMRLSQGLSVALQDDHKAPPGRRIAWTRHV